MKNKIISFLRGLFLWDAKDILTKETKENYHLFQGTFINNCAVPEGSIFIAEPTEYEDSFLGVDMKTFTIILNRQFREGDILYIEGVSRILVYESHKVGFAYSHKVTLLGNTDCHISAERLAPGTILKETKDDYRSLASYEPVYPNQKRYASRIKRGEAKTNRSTTDYISEVSFISSLMENSSSSSSESSSVDFGGGDFGGGGAGGNW